MGGALKLKKKRQQQDSKRNKIQKLKQNKTMWQNFPNTHTHTVAQTHHSHGKLFHMENFSKAKQKRK